MNLCDVNVYLYAFDADGPSHRAARAWLDGQLNGVEPLGYSELALSGFARVVTNRKIYSKPATLEQAFRFVDFIVEHENSVRVAPAGGHFKLFRELCIKTKSRANLVPDCYFAALAMEAGCTFATADLGFARYASSGLKVLNPLLE